MSHDHSIVDCHVHLEREDGYVEKHLREMDRLNIAQSWLLAVEEDQYAVKGGFPGYADNDEVLKAAKMYPDRFVAFAYIRLDRENADDVVRYAEQGFMGLKIINTAYPYDHDKYFESYRKAQELGMVLLFHTGVVGYSAKDGEYNVSSANMRPVFLDRIGRAFPSLDIIGAHLGCPWIQEACAVSRHVPNVYFDLSGGVNGWRKLMDASDWRKVFAWKCMFGKILFGTDVSYPRLKPSLDIYEEIFEMVNADEEQKALIMGKSSSRIMNRAKAKIKKYQDEKS